VHNLLKSYSISQNKLTYMIYYWQVINYKVICVLVKVAIQQVQQNL